MQKRIIATKEMISRTLEEGDIVDGYIMLNGGFRSSKTISPIDGGGCVVFNNIDDTHEQFNNIDDMFRETNIGKAIEKNAFIVWEDK